MSGCDAIGSEYPPLPLREPCASRTDGLKQAIGHLAESWAWGRTLRSWNIAGCLRRNRFSATTAARDLVAKGRSGPQFESL